jgi:hypothetical protein
LFGKASPTSLPSIVPLPKQSKPKPSYSLLAMSSTLDHTAESLETEKYIGLCLSLASGILIGVSFIITKKGLMETAKKGGEW